MTRVSVAIRALRCGSWGDLRDVGEAQLALLRAQASRWLKPVGEFVEVTPADAGQGDTPAAPAQTQTCERIASAIDRAARYGVFHPLCLTRAAALSQMLDAHGITGHRIRVGVRRDGEAFVAHAWVELGQLVLGDTTVNTRAYLPLTSVGRKGSGATSALQRKAEHEGPD